MQQDTLVVQSAQTFISLFVFTLLCHNLQKKRGRTLNLVFFTFIPANEEKYCITVFCSAV